MKKHTVQGSMSEAEVRAACEMKQPSYLAKLLADNALLYQRGYTFSGMVHDTLNWHREEPEVRCASIIPGGVQCVKQQGHEPTAHKYENRAGFAVRFSTHVSSECIRVELEP
jgi:hypothetical protein